MPSISGLNVLYLLVSVDVLKKTIVEKLPDDLEALEMTMGRLHSMVDTVFKYVEDVVVMMSFLYVVVMISILT